MKRVALTLFLVGVLLTGCGESSPAPAEEPPQEQQVAQEETQEETNEYEDLAVPFESVHSGADVNVKEREAFFEVYVSASDLDVNTQPENWESLRTTLIDAMNESQSVSDSNYEGKSVSVQLKDGTGAILCSGYGGKIQYDAFATASSAQAGNDARITLAEYNQLVVGMTYSQCVEIIGGDGTMDIEVGSTDSSIGSMRNYTWQGTSEYSSATLSFDDFVLYSKFQIGLE